MKHKMTLFSHKTVEPFGSRGKNSITISLSKITFNYKWNLQIINYIPSPKRFTL